MADEEKLIDSIKKVELGDLKILIFGIVLLAVPVGLLMFLISRGSVDDNSRESFRHMSARRSKFNFGTAKRNKSARSLGGKKAGWLSGETNEMRVEREIDEAMSHVIRSCKERKPELKGFSSNQKKVYRAETNFYITSADGALEMNNIQEAEKNYLQALSMSDDNTWLKILALGGLIEVYDRKKDKREMKRAFAKYMVAITQLPPEFGTKGMGKNFMNISILLEKMREGSMTLEITREILKNKSIRGTGLSASTVKAGLSSTLDVLKVDGLGGNE